MTSSFEKNYPKKSKSSKINLFSYFLTYNVISVKKKINNFFGPTEVQKRAWFRTKTQIKIFFFREILFLIEK